MRGLTIIVAEAAPVRLRAALTLACAQAALGGGARLFLDAAAVPLLRLPVTGADDADQVAAGLPALAALIDEAIGLGVRLSACQTGLALAGLSAEALDPRVEWGGVTSLLATLGEDRLLAF